MGWIDIEIRIDGLDGYKDYDIDGLDGYRDTNR